ncbi:MAG TPA: Fe-Mn family superoxide dismutase [Chitinispirillaceae bacterium]|nr:Fe-Mn family superoxide dismutase [Chitinispirillaceae bacterium]
MTTRRDFLRKSAIGTTAAAAMLSGLIQPASADEIVVPLKFQPLPYPENALEPSISAQTIKIHYGEHHRKFVDKVIARVKGTNYQNSTLERIIMETYGGINKIEELHLAAIMAWNHQFYWKSMKPNGGGEMPEQLRRAIVNDFGSVDAFKVKLKETAMTLGSGWTWLVSNNGKLAVTYTTCHEIPLQKKQHPLLTIDCWEHAYYLDYQNRKDEYIDAFLNKLVDWQFTQSNIPVAALVSAQKKLKMSRKTPIQADTGHLRPVLISQDRLHQ